MTTRKQCRRCLRARPLDKFWRDRRSRDGIRGICKTCTNLAKGNAAHRHEVDPAAVERAVMGDPPLGLTTAERRVAVRILTEKALNYRDIAAHLHVATRTITRDRRHLALVPPLCSACLGTACRWHQTEQAAA